MIGAFLLRYKLHVYRQDPLGGGGGRLGMFKTLGSHVTVSISLLYLRFSLSLLQFQLISLLFVAISAVLCCCFKAMSLVRINYYPDGAS